VGKALEVTFIDHDYMIEQIVSKASNPSFGNSDSKTGIPPRWSGDASRSCCTTHSLVKCSVASKWKISRRLIAETVRSEISNPSFNSSPWMRGAPQVGFSLAMVWMALRRSRAVIGLPTLLSRPKAPVQERETSPMPAAPPWPALRSEAVWTTLATAGAASPRTVSRNGANAPAWFVASRQSTVASRPISSPGHVETERSFSA
jgi:hypothetical protein